MQGNNDGKNEETDEHAGEAPIEIEKGSPADRVLRLLRHHQIDAEITGTEVVAGAPGRQQLVRLEGVICKGQVASSVTIWATILPSGMAYLLSAQGPGETDVPLWPRLFERFLQGNTGAGKDSQDATGEGDA